MTANAFIDNNYPPGKEFFVQFLSSPDFTKETLRRLAQTQSRHDNKRQIALQIANAHAEGKLSNEEILLAYVQQPRMWLSLKRGKSLEFPSLKSPTQLLTEFGEEGWYGPIKEPNSSRYWYIRTHKIADYVRTGEKVDTGYIRWCVFASVEHDFVALSWKGFYFTEITDEHIDTPAQFPFWKHIPQLFDELAKDCQAQWLHPDLYQLILVDLWDKYLNNTQKYIWRHLKIRAEESGVALNAHSAGVAEINVNGLQALSRKLAESALEELGDSNNIEKINRVENALLRTLIKEWGTKSYEFSLAQQVNPSQAGSEGNEQKPKLEKLFKAHCYFGLKQNSSSQDSLQHLKCDSRYVSSIGVLKFLLRELRLRG